ncbi:MAG: hypothetical protein GKR89_01285 [Candidatus Latescibacteria bacterium]|nr:hypothetical protein [Candidatus Latescibacterota bacterium]
MTSPPNNKPSLPQWAPRLPQELIARLYIADAQGLQRADLVDEVGVRLLLRCESVLAATEAVRGCLPCPDCGRTIVHGGAPAPKKRAGKKLRCPACPWEVEWKEWVRTYRGEHLGAGGIEPFVRDFVAGYPRAQTVPEKTILIDGLIYRYHHELVNRPRKVGAVNLIEGRQEEVIAFLERLTYSQQSTPQVLQTARRWRAIRAGQQGGRA